MVPPDGLRVETVLFLNPVLRALVVLASWSFSDLQLSSFFFVSL